MTSGGGFVVWKLPEVITDNIPYMSLYATSRTLRLISHLVDISCSCQADPLHSIKWRCRQADTLTVASETKMYLVDAAHTFRGEPQPQVGPDCISQVGPGADQVDGVYAQLSKNCLFFAS